MGFAKDIVKDNKKIILLTLGLLTMSIVGMFLINNGILNFTPSTMYEDLYTQPNEVIEEEIDYKAVIKTIYGDIKIDLYEDKAPNAVNSFLFLVGEDFYDGLKFHKVITDFVLQAGDHIGDGNGNPGYELEQDINDLEIDEYSMSMVNGSQFFIVPKGADVSQLSEYTVMGEVISGFSVVDAIEKVAVDEYIPQNDVTISSILIIEE